MMIQNNLKFSKSEVEKYIDENKEKVNFLYRHQYHFQPAIGWINDPNGFSYYKGEYHLFYQYYPFNSHWGLMYWGHSTSIDLIHWEHKAIALYPDEVYDWFGCYSGSAIVENNEQILMYTGIMNADSDKCEIIDRKDMKSLEFNQVQCIAREKDGVYVKSSKNPVIGPADLPAFIQPGDFRDPKIIKKDNDYYAIIGAKTKWTEDKPAGMLLLYKSKNLENWDYIDVIMKSDNNNDGVLECPDFFELDGRDVFLYSEQFKEKEEYLYHNVNSCLYKSGYMNWNTYEHEVEFMSEIDLGLDFYAPQTLVDPLGRRIMIAWMQMWGRSIPTHELNHGWAGSMTFPRVLSMVGGRLYQEPVEELKQYRQNHINYDITFKQSLQLDGIKGKTIDLIIDFQLLEATTIGLELFKSKHEETLISYDVDKGEITFDRTNSLHSIIDTKTKEVDGVRKVKIKPRNGHLQLRLLLDNSSVEMFVNQGELAMTHRVFSEHDADEIMFFADKDVRLRVDKYDLVLEN